jgi:anti-anti-sigma regulatory factor
LANETGQIFFGQLADQVVVVRIVGRGNHELSPTFKRLVDSLNRPDYSPRYVLDLSECVGLDSTFMGTMATLALHQMACRKDRVVLVNANAVTRRQMTTLGLNYLLDIQRDGGGEPTIDRENLQKVQRAEDQSRFDKLVHMIQAHETLVDVNSGNDVIFRQVLDNLHQSLEQEQQDRGRS